MADPDLMVGFDSNDDAAVYRIDENTALIQTVDIFPPVVDDAYTYGQIAAANALSDVYAMGGTPKLALNICCLPENLPDSTIREILRGGIDKVKEAGAVIAGGHTIQDHELKYGLSVTGFIKPSEVLTNNGVQPGDCLVLTKPIGTGILTTAAKVDLLSQESYECLVRSMAALNKDAAEVMSHWDVHACTDVTGFGLAGHTKEMVAGSGQTAVIDCRSVPVLPDAEAFASEGIIPAGAYRNRSYIEAFVKTQDVPLAKEDLMFDPQTSGGLLIALPAKDAANLTKAMGDQGIDAAVIGEILPFKEAEVIIK